MKILEGDLELFSKLDVGAKLWKIGHYPIIEALRARGKCSTQGNGFLPICY